MGRDQEQPQGLRGHEARHLTDAEHVTERLRHLLFVEAHEAVVEEEANEGLATRALGLRDLVFVVREDQVLAAGMDVEGLAEELRRHRRALDVPAGPAAAPRARPGRLASLLVLGRDRLPEREVHRVALARVDLDARAGDHVA